MTRRVEVVTAADFCSARRRDTHVAPVGSDHGEAEHFLRASCRSARALVPEAPARQGPCATDRRIGAGIDREEQSGALEIGFSCSRGHARLDAGSRGRRRSLGRPGHRRERRGTRRRRAPRTGLERRRPTRKADHRHGAPRGTAARSRLPPPSTSDRPTTSGGARSAKASPWPCCCAPPRWSPRARHQSATKLRPISEAKRPRQRLSRGKRRGRSWAPAVLDDYFHNASTANTSTAALWPLMATGAPSERTQWRRRARPAWAPSTRMGVARPSCAPRAGPRG